MRPMIRTDRDVARSGLEGRDGALSFMPAAIAGLPYVLKMFRPGGRENPCNPLIRLGPILDQSGGWALNSLRSFQLPKLGVVGSNPIARSKEFNDLWTSRAGRFEAVGK